MSVTLIYIPDKYLDWNKIPKDFTDTVIEESKKFIADNLYYYEDDGSDPPNPKRDSKLMWDKLITEGYVTEDLFGYYDDGNGYYMCPIFENIATLAFRLGLNIEYIDQCEGDLCCIVNLSSEKYSKLKTHMIRKILR